MQAAGLATSLPEVSSNSKQVWAEDTWDAVLAAGLVAGGEEVVTNDLSLTGAERILVISGPNQGGKTTMARTLGLLCYLAALGCPVPGRNVRVPLCDQMLTAFDREEEADDLDGRLGLEITRLHNLFYQATERSAIIINEPFGSTTRDDALILTRDDLERISRLDAIAACVTFLGELSELNDKTVSMVSTVDERDPAVRTMRVVRRRSDGRAYAHALALRHGLTRDAVTATVAEWRRAGARAGRESASFGPGI